MDLVRRAQIILLAVKPQDFSVLASELGALRRNQLVISIMAGFPLSKLKTLLCHQRLVRAMPNLAARVGQAYTVWQAGVRLSAKERQIVAAVFSSLGKSVEVHNEDMIDRATALSGSGPAYFFLLAEKMIEAAYELGMKVDLAKKLVYQTAFGSGKVLTGSAEDPEDLIAKVASKGGTTEAALKMFQKKGFGKIVQDGIKAAYKRSKQLRNDR